MSLRIHLERFPSTLLSSIALTPLRFPNVITTRVPSEKVLFGEEVVLFEEEEAVLFEEEEVVLFEEEVVLFEEVDVLFEDVLFEDDDFVSFFFINLT